MFCAIPLEGKLRQEKDGFRCIQHWMLLSVAERGHVHKIGLALLEGRGIRGVEDYCLRRRLIVHRKRTHGGTNRRVSRMRYLNALGILVLPHMADQVSLIVIL